MSIPIPIDIDILKLRYRSSLLLIKQETRYFYTYYIYCPPINRENEISVLYIIDIRIIEQRCSKKQPVVNAEFTNIHVLFTRYVLYSKKFLLTQATPLLNRTINLMFNFYDEDLQNFDVCHLEIWQQAQLINMITFLRNYLTISVQNDNKKTGIFQI